jgi:hypothetical protein
MLPREWRAVGLRVGPGKDRLGWLWAGPRKPLCPQSPTVGVLVVNCSSPGLILCRSPLARCLMILPFSRRQFYEVFELYNVAIWPVPALAYGLGLIALVFLFQPGRAADRVCATVLAAMWVWTGVGYHWLHFARINQAALLFGAAFLLQGLLLLFYGWKGRLSLGRVIGVRGGIGLVFIGYAMVVYPLLGRWAGHAYPSVPTFGITPCPVTIFTLGCLILNKTRVPGVLLVIPVLWSLIGGSAAFLLGVPQDWVLLFSGAATIALLRWTSPLRGEATYSARASHPS